MTQYLNYMVMSLISLILVLLMTLISVAFLTLFERKIMSLFHYRKGPNKVSILGLMQPFSDALKLLSKEIIFPGKSNFYTFLMSPMLMFILIMLTWLIYPFFSNLLNFKMNTLYFLCMMSMGVYSLMLMGWSSNSSFSMIGAIRSIAQSISYEVTFSISLLMMMCLINSLNLMNLFHFSKYIWMIMLMTPMATSLLMSMLAEINRTPFDLSEGESELVSGFNIEYSASKFTIIFLSEYASLMFMMFLFNMLFLFSNYFNLKFYIYMTLMIFFITWIRMTFPRMRYDYLMNFCWFTMLPMILISYSLYLTMFKMNLDFSMN